jgi:hypothetical protein
MMEKEFVPYEEAFALKELGFAEPCNTCYDKLEMVASYGASVFDYKNYNTSGYMVSRPTFSQAFRWFREKYDLHVQIRKENYFHESKYEYFHFDISKGEENDITKQLVLFDNIMDECTQDITGNHLNDEKYSKLIFEKRFAFRTYEEIEIECLKKLIEIIKTV